MKYIIMANGEYGELSLYKEILSSADRIICADGGANYAYLLGVRPDCIIGDMDSISKETQKFYSDQGVSFHQYPCRKDFTDTQLAMSMAEEMGAQEIVLLGTQGKRFDHSLSNLYCGLKHVKRGVKIIHYGPECTVYLVCNQMSLQGRPGDLVSVLPLGGGAAGVCLKNFQYPLENVVLECDNPYAISNVLLEDSAQIQVEKGVVAVFHYSSLVAGL